jgi:hypothetical protein
VWTPKRIFLLALGFALLFASFLVYAHYLGGIDGLPPLPEAYLPQPGDPVDLPPPRPSQVDERLEMAFGGACKELLRPIRLEVHSHGIVLSTDSYVIERDGPHIGQVRFQPLSLAIFNKKTPPGQFPEINTIRCKTAYISFDRPIGTLLDMSKAKIVGAELHDKIEIVNNRRKAHSNEELVVWVPKGPLTYHVQPPPAAGSERQPEVSTDDLLELTDHQTKPEPTRVRAVGMDLYLTQDSHPTAPGQQAPRKQRTESISGVERIHLRADVEMILYTDPREGFMATTSKPPPVPSTAKANATTGKPVSVADKTKIIIKTPGPFDYDLNKDFAIFEVPSRPSLHLPQPVTVQRIAQPLANPNSADQLDCERLELQFRRKKPADTKAAASDGHSVELEIDTAHATGKEVVLTSDAEMLHILEANDFFYEAQKRRTAIMGNQKIIVVKDGHDLTARELHIEELPQGGQRLTAFGPGTIALLDKETRKRSVNAKWNDKLISSKDGDLDLLILTGEASFEDKEHEQYLQGEEVKVWLEPSTPTKASAPSPQGSGQGGRRPHRIEATGRVLARSREMNVHDTEKMVLTFKDAPVGPKLSAGGAIAAPERGGTATPPATGPISVPKPAAPSQPDKPARPIDLSAHLVEAHVLRLDASKNELDRLRTEGQVRVRQAPEKPDEKGLDIVGDTLEMTKKPDGNEIVVTGDLAELQMAKLTIRGPQVNIDQAENKAWVNGDGAMTIESDRSFQGALLKQPVPLTIIWNKSMFFQGARADFEGGIQAEQENAHLACQSLQVNLDRPISLKEGEKNGPPAKVDRLVCDKSVLVEDSEYENGQLIKYQRIECRELDVDNVKSEVHAYGPGGKLRIFQPGDAGSPLAPPPASPPGDKKKAQEMKLTLVWFGGRMWADNKSHTAIFNDNVEALNLATENKDLEPDLDHLPDDAVYLRCADQMKVYNRPENGKSNQQLEAEGRVFCRTKEYEALSEKTTFNEAKDQLIFDGGDGGLARLKKILGIGIPPQESKAKRFIYLRKTGQVFSDQVQGVRGATR